MNTKIEPYQQFLIVSAMILFVLTFFIPEKYNLYDYLKSIRLQSYNAKHKEIFIKCLYCKGTGEREEDVNKIMFDAKMALYLNKHLKIDRCPKCVKLPYGEHYDYCDSVNNHYKILLQEYGAAGPKMQKTMCGHCMGMGEFSSLKQDGTYLTQEEYEKREKEKHETN
jgi:hypothetical protein